jgi:hypothetical protein
MPNKKDRPSNPRHPGDMPQTEPSMTRQGRQRTANNERSHGEATGKGKDNSSNMTEKK